MSFSRYRLKRIASLTALFVFTLAYSEVFVRIFDPQPIMPRYVTGTAMGIRGNIPHARYRHTTPEVTSEFNINSLGMRDEREFPFQKPEGVCRIALFGDSFFMGYELDLKDTFAVRLEQELHATGLAVELLNFSVSGFGTAEMLRSYERFGKRFGADLVIFEWHSTDPTDNIRSNLYRLSERDGLVDTGNSYLPSIALQDLLMRSRLYTFVADNSHLYSVIREKTAAMAKRLLASFHRIQIISNAKAGPAIGESDGDATPYSFKLSVALLRAAQASARSAGAGFMVVEIPVSESRTEFASAISVLDANELVGIPVVSPVDSFRRLALTGRKIFYEKGQGHITPLAVDAMARMVAADIVQRNALSICDRRSAPSDRNQASLTEESRP
jgi:hypothetical protein